jgi:cell wall-associated NlpC family hydrolase
MKISFVIVFLLISIAGQSGNKASASVQTASEIASKTLTRADIIQFAKTLLGTPYRIAGSNPLRGFDCSGFVSYVFRNFKINLPHSSCAFDALGAAVKPEEFKVGDVLVFYGFKNKERIGHVGIICEADGLNSRFIHSSSGKVHCVTISELGSGMYKKRFYKCIDVIH